MHARRRGRARRICSLLSYLGETRDEIDLLEEKVPGCWGSHERRAAHGGGHRGLARRRAALRPSPAPEHRRVTIAHAIRSCANELPACHRRGSSRTSPRCSGARGCRSRGRSRGRATALRRASAYDDDVLARLVTGARLDDVLAAYAHSRPAIAGAVAHRRRRIARRACSRRVVEPGGAATCARAPRDERESRRRAALSADHARRLTEHIRRLARGSRQARALVDDREVFAIDHLACCATSAGT